LVAAPLLDACCVQSELGIRNPQFPREATFISLLPWLEAHAAHDFSRNDSHVTKAVRLSRRNEHSISPSASRAYDFHTKRLPLYLLPCAQGAHFSRKAKSIWMKSRKTKKFFFHFPKIRLWIFLFLILNRIYAWNFKLIASRDHSELRMYSNNIQIKFRKTVIYSDIIKLQIYTYIYICYIYLYMLYIYRIESDVMSTSGNMSTFYISVTVDTSSANCCKKIYICLRDISICCEVWSI